MKAFLVFLALFPSLASSGSASTLRGSHAERDDLLRSYASDLVSEARALSAIVPHGVVPTEPTAASAVITASSHVVQWGSAQNGCSYALPPVTVSCGTGGTIALGHQSEMVKGCVTRNRNTIVCSSVASPSANPEVTVTCFGTTTAQQTASVFIPASQATCNKLLGDFPQSQLAIRGGAATVFALLGRYCKSSNGALSFNTKYSCGSGSTLTTQGTLSFCAAEASCNARVPCNSTTPEKACQGQCADNLAAVTVSDQDTRAECVNAGPRPHPLPAGLHTITWSNFHPGCSSSTNTLTASCGTGGSIAVASTGGSVSKCTAVSTSSVQCTTNPTPPSASIVFYCYGSTATARTASAFLPKSTATNCATTTVNTIRVASQAVILQRFCGNGTLTAQPSKACGNSSQLLINQPNNNPICISSNRCTSTPKSSCSIPLDAISVTDATTDPTCAVMGPKSLNF